MYKPHPRLAFIRLMVALAASASLLTGVTFAVLRSNAVMLEGSTISSATAKLGLSSNGTSFGVTIPGFEFGGVEPGGAMLPGRDIYFKNEGTAKIRLGLNLSTMLGNPNNIKLNQVSVVLTPQAGGQAERFTLSSLYDAYDDGIMVPLGTEILPGQIARYSMQVEMSATAVPSSETTATLRNVDFLFMGSSING